MFTFAECARISPRRFCSRIDECLQSLINNEIAEITRKIAALDTIRERLEEDLLRLQEEDLELDDECERRAA
jgi:hypothetical protein